MPTTMLERPVAQVVLRALKTVADASRGFHETERDLLAAAAHVLNYDGALDELTPVDPEEAGQLVTTERDRLGLVEDFCRRARSVASTGRT